MLRAIVADADEEELDQLINLIDWKDESIDLVATAMDGNELLSLIKALRPDLVILDTELSGEMNGIDNNQDVCVCV